VVPLAAEVGTAVAVRVVRQHGARCAARAQRRGVLTDGGRRTAIGIRAGTCIYRRRDCTALGRTCRCPRSRRCRRPLGDAPPWRYQDEELQLELECRDLQCRSGGGMHLTQLGKPRSGTWGWCLRGESEEGTPFPCVRLLDYYCTSC
jgi:hypothetical protein